MILANNQTTKIIFKRLLFMITIILSCFCYRTLNTYRGTYHDLSIYIDKTIPFCSYFIYPYIFWYIYLGFFLLYYACIDGNIYKNLLIDINIGLLICYIIYYFFPTHITRPNVSINGMSTYLVYTIYRSDNPFNCFPSIHVFDTYLICLYINKDSFIKVPLKILSYMIGFLIILSVVFIKQHFVLDAVPSIILAYILFYKNYIIKKLKFL